MASRRALVITAGARRGAEAAALAAAYAGIEEAVILSPEARARALTVHRVTEEMHAAARNLERINAHGRDDSGRVRTPSYAEWCAADQRYMDAVAAFERLS